MCIMHPKYKSTPATNSCNRGGFIRKGVLTLPAPFFTQLQINLWYKNFMYVCSSREMVPSLRQKTHPVCVIEQSTHNAVSSIRCPFRKSE